MGNPLYSKKGKVHFFSKQHLSNLGERYIRAILRLGQKYEILAGSWILDKGDPSKQAEGGGGAVSVPDILEASDNPDR